MNQGKERAEKKNKENERGKKYRIGMQHTTTPRGWWGRGEEVVINTRSVALRGRVGGCPRNGARWPGATVRS
jgi:hypothetical protein